LHYHIYNAKYDNARPDPLGLHDARPAPRKHGKKVVSPLLPAWGLNFFRGLGENHSVPGTQVQFVAFCKTVVCPLLLPYKKPYYYIDTKHSSPYSTCMTIRSDFEWDARKDSINLEKHGVSFALAQLAFLDHHRIILEDLEHSTNESRYYCLGRVADGILTVRFTYRKSKIRIIGAGFWRKGRKIYEKENKVHR